MSPFCSRTPSRQSPADGLLIEAHPCPAQAWCDADQALSIDEFTTLMTRLRAVAHAIGRSIEPPREVASSELVMA